MLVGAAPIHYLMLDRLAADRARVADLEAQILHLHNSISTLRAERNLAQERLDSYRYPILTLPNEITSEVFMHFLPDYLSVLPSSVSTRLPSSPASAEDGEKSRLALPECIVILARVFQEASRLEDLKLDVFAASDLLPTPVTAFCGFVGTGCADPPRRSLMAKFGGSINWIVLRWRSNGTKTQIEVKALTRQTVGKKVPRLTEALPRRTNPKIGRCPQALDAVKREKNPYVGTASMHPRPMSAQKCRSGLGTLPLLRRLNLSLENPEPVGDIMLFRHAPQLRTALLNDGACISVVLPWAQLTSVTLDPVFLHECIPVLQQTSNLMHCELGLLHGGSGDSTQLKLPHLETLILRENKYPVAGYLDSLVLPALRSLSVPELFLGTNPIDALTSFVAKSGCRLEELRITGRIETVQIYRQAFPSIRTLSFHGWQSPGRAETPNDHSDVASETESIPECDELYV
ncbi:hypothetical protein B0H16DRAFT_1768717 [Mycena metata]|uniref:F-box domain-containing protein n=1 Tax=Mycena metata TaxID=1033252 RepID=A0AAD7NRX9_9AGAR|nr:hypothetical protein B0H16DRAFT_1768717 [Mycena metata]